MTDKEMKAVVSENTDVAEKDKAEAGKKEINGNRKSPMLRAVVLAVIVSFIADILFALTVVASFIVNMLCQILK